MFRFLIFIIIVSGASAAQADVVATNGAVIVSGNRFYNTDNSSRPLYRQHNNNIYARDNVVVTDGNSHGAMIVKHGNVIVPQNGATDLGNGSTVNVDQGRITNGNVGHARIRN